MITLKSFACGKWQAPRQGRGQVLRHAVTGEEMATTGSEGLDFAAMLDYGRRVGGPRLRGMTFPERSALLKKMADVLNGNVKEFHQIAATYGATQSDALMDVEGGIGTLGVYASLGFKQLPKTTFLTDGDVARLSKEGTFVGRHIYVPLEGVAVQINAYNFPSWGMLEKLAPSLLAGMPAIAKPATATAWLTFRMVEVLIDSGVMPDGSLQLICGSLGNLLHYLTCQDVVSFTGSAETGHKIKSHPNIVRHAVRLNMEADSLNCIVLGLDVPAGAPTFDRFIKEIVREMTVKAGQKCTAIRRVLVPNEKKQSVLQALRQRLAGIKVGDPAAEGVRMGPLVSRSAVDSAKQNLALLTEEAEVVFGDPDRIQFEGADGQQGAFLEPILLDCGDPEGSSRVHEIEVFGPVATVMGYGDTDQAIRLARRGGGSLVASVYSEDEAFITRLTFGLAPYHGRLMVMNEKAAGESTGHGVAMPQLVHGGPGRAGGGEELGGLRSLYHYMQRVALQGSPERLERLCAPATAG